MVSCISARTIRQVRLSGCTGASSIGVLNHLLLHHSHQRIICGVFRIFYLLFSLGLSFPYPNCWVFHLAFSLVASILTAYHVLENTFLYYFFTVSYQIGAFNLASESELVAKKNYLYFTTWFRSYRSRRPLPFRY